MKKGNICGICVKMVAAWGVFYESQTQIAQMKAPLTRQGLLTQTDNADSVEVNLLTVEPGVFLGAEPIPNARYSDMMLNKKIAVSALKWWRNGESSMRAKRIPNARYRDRMLLENICVSALKCGSMGSLSSELIQ